MVLLLEKLVPYEVPRSGLEKRKRHHSGHEDTSDLRRSNEIGSEGVRLGSEENYKDIGRDQRCLEGEGFSSLFDT